MDTFNVPLLAESTSSSSNYATAAVTEATTSNHHQHHLQHQQQQHLMSHHHKDQMLAAGSSPMLPFLSYSQLQLQHKDSTATSSSNGVTAASEGAEAAAAIATDNFDGSQLDGGISLSGLCERFFVASPNPHSNSNMTLMGATTPTTTTTTQNNISINNNNNLEAKNGTIHTSAGAPQSLQRGGGSVIIESVTVPSFSNILFSHRNSQATTNECIDPALLQKSTLSSSSIIEYHQLKPLAASATNSASVSTTNFLSSSTAQLLDFDVQAASKDDSHISTTTTIAGVGIGSGSGSSSVSGSGAATTTRTTTTANQTRSSLHSIEELAASSCVAPKATQSPNANENENVNHRSTSSTTHQQQQQQQQQHHMQQSGNHSGSNLSSDDESVSEDEFGLEIDDHGVVWQYSVALRKVCRCN